MIFSCLEAIVCTPYSQAKSKSEISQEFSQLKSIERGPWQKLGVRHMTQNKRNKIVFVHEQVIICDHYSNSNFYKKIKKIEHWKYGWDYILISLDIGNCRNSI